MKTDIAGAAMAGLDTLFVTQGIHCPDLHSEDLESPADRRRLQRLFVEHGFWPTAAISALRP
jgi:ribonucleotide monophosphatase NagD (HAD superfamily)